MSEQDQSQELREMANLTILNNRICETQIQNLKMYALVFFDGVKTARIRYDVSTRRDTNVEIDEVRKDAKYSLKMQKNSGSKITYDIDIDENSVNESLDYRLKTLERSVRSLFWSDLTVEVRFNGQQVFRSEDV